MWVLAYADGQQDDWALALADELVHEKTNKQNGLTDAYRWGLILANGWIQTACWCWNDDSRAAQPAGLAGSPSLLANIVNSPVPTDTNALNAPAVDDVIEGNAGVAPGVTPNDDLTITNPVVVR